MDMTEEMTDYVLRNKGAKQTPELKSFNPKYKWMLFDKLLHRQAQRITDREAHVMFRKHIIESQKELITEMDSTDYMGFITEILIYQHQLNKKSKIDKNVCKN